MFPRGSRGGASPAESSVPAKAQTHGKMQGALQDRKKMQVTRVRDVGGIHSSAAPPWALRRKNGWEEDGSRDLGQLRG